MFSALGSIAKSFLPVLGQAVMPALKTIGSSLISTLIPQAVNKIQQKTGVGLTQNAYKQMADNSAKRWAMGGTQFQSGQDQLYHRYQKPKKQPLIGMPSPIPLQVQADEMQQQPVAIQNQEPVEQLVIQPPRKSILKQPQKAKAKKYKYLRKR